MIIRKNMSNTKEGCSCKNCDFYPFFHYMPSDNGFYIEYIKHDHNNSVVINHTTNEKYIYSNKIWKQVN